MRKKYWRHIDCPTILILLSSVGIATAQSYPEIVIPVSHAEARRAIELDRGWEMRYEIASWQSKGRIRIAKINGETLALAGELVQFTPFEDVDPIVVMSDGLEPTEHAALFIWNKNNVRLKVYPVFEASADGRYSGGDGKPEEVDRAAKAYGVFGNISTDATGRLSMAKPLNGHLYAIRRLQNNSAPEYVMIFEPVRQGPEIMIDDMRSVDQREADYNSPRMVAHRKTEEYRRQKENDDSYRDHLLAWEARYQARVKASAGDK